MKYSSGVLIIASNRLIHREPGAKRDDDDKAKEGGGGGTAGRKLSLGTQMTLRERQGPIVEKSCKKKRRKIAAVPQRSPEQATWAASGFPRDDDACGMQRHRMRVTLMTQCVYAERTLRHSRHLIRLLREGVSRRRRKSWLEPSSCGPKFMRSANYDSEGGL